MAMMAPEPIRYEAWESTVAERDTLRVEVKRLRAELKAAVEIGAGYAFDNDDSTSGLVYERALTQPRLDGATKRKYQNAVRRAIREMTKKKVKG